MIDETDAKSGPLLLGVTGNIACGKTAVMRVLRDLGAETIDADLVYRDLVQPGMPLLEGIRRRFGEGVVDADGALARRALAAVVFSDPSALAALDDLVRPVVGPEMLRRAAAAKAPVVALDAVKLFESGLAQRCNETWVVVCNPESQARRLMGRNGVDRGEAIRRIAAQRPQEEKTAQADVVIENDDGLDGLAKRVRVAFGAFLARHGLPAPSGSLA